MKKNEKKINKQLGLHRLTSKAYLLKRIKVLGEDSVMKKIHFMDLANGNLTHYNAQGLIETIPFNKKRYAQKRLIN